MEIVSSLDLCEHIFLFPVSSMIVLFSLLLRLIFTSSSVSRKNGRKASVGKCQRKLRGGRGGRSRVLKAVLVTLVSILEQQEDFEGFEASV